MAVTTHLADKSALARGHVGAVATKVDRLLTAGRLAMCGMVALEILYSARNRAEHDELSNELTTAYEWLHTDDEDFDRAIEVNAELTSGSKHRTVALPDLIIAAVAERHRVTVLHYDSDFDLIAEVTGQPTEWVAERGSVD